MDNIRVSVLIPVFGVEKYIERCARSLFEQTMKDGIEFIFVNDCTKDHSIEILRKVLGDYPGRKDQVRIINHNTNQGLAVARVSGVKASRGEYVIHCDSDDWVDPNMFELMYEEAKRKDADIVGCDFWIEDGAKKTLRKQDFSLNQKDAVIEILKGDMVLDSYLWSRMIKRSFYLTNKFYAPAEVTLLEDMAVVIPMHLQTEKVSKINIATYHYRQDTDGMSRIMTPQKIESALHVLNNIIYNYVKDDKNLLYAYQKAIIKFARPLIIQKETYDPQRWREVTTGISLSTFGTLRQRITPFLIRIHWEKFDKFLRAIFC